MSTIKCAGTLMAADADARTLTYRLLPFGEPGRTNVGTITAGAGAVTVPEDGAGLIVNEEHDPKRPLGRFESVAEDAGGLVGTVKIAATRAGDDALELARVGLRTGISVELAEGIVRAGRLVSSRLTGAGLVARSAFPSAQLVTAADTPDPAHHTKENPVTETPETPETPEPPAEGVQAPPIHAGAAPRIDLGAITRAALEQGEPGQITAALADLKTTDDAGKLYIRDQEIGELWEARKTERKVIESIGVKPLTSLTLVGQRKTRKFKVADWAGNKAEVPTGKFTTSQETWKGSAKAVGVDVALELIEFGSQDVMADLWAQALDSYIEQTEDEVVAAMLSGATAKADVPDVIAGVANAAQAFATAGARMTGIVVAGDVFGTLLTMPTSEAPWWFGQQARMDLAGATFDGGGVTFSVSDELPAGTVLVYDRRAVDYRESRTIKLNAVNVAQGGYDLAFIKFRAVKILDAGAIMRLTLAKPAAPAA